MSTLEINELKQKISDLVAENDRIKKTSKQRFESNKTLSRSKKRHELLESRFVTMRDFLDGRGIPMRVYQGEPRPDWSLFDEVKGLINKETKLRAPEVQGVYCLKVDGEYLLAKIKHSICWMVAFKNNDGEYGEYNGLHFSSVSEFILINHEEGC